MDAVVLTPVQNGRKAVRPSVRASDPRLVRAKKLHGDQTLRIGPICRTLKSPRSTYDWYVAN